MEAQWLEEVADEPECGNLLKRGLRLKAKCQKKSASRILQLKPAHLKIKVEL